jgi:single-strand DNA-binding protein
MNLVILTGRWTQKPELRYTPNGTPVAKCRIAVNRMGAREGQPEADFITVICWNKTAENVANYTDKGHLIGVRGRLQIRQYEDNQGVKRWATEVVANEVEFLAKPQNSQNSNNKNQSGDDYNFGPEIEFSEEEIPF